MSYKRLFMVITILSVILLAIGSCQSPPSSLLKAQTKLNDINSQKIKIIENNNIISIYDNNKVIVTINNNKALTILGTSPCSSLLITSFNILSPGITITVEVVETGEILGAYTGVGIHDVYWDATGKSGTYTIKETVIGPDGVPQIYTFSYKVPGYCSGKPTPTPSPTITPTPIIQEAWLTTKILIVPEKKLSISAVQDATPRTIEYVLGPWKKGVALEIDAEIPDYALFAQAGVNCHLVTEDTNESVYSYSFEIDKTALAVNNGKYIHFQPWDGIDQQSGKYVKSGNYILKASGTVTYIDGMTNLFKVKAYMKVILTNPFETPRNVDMAKFNRIFYVHDWSKFIPYNGTKPKEIAENMYNTDPNGNPTIWYQNALNSAINSEQWVLKNVNQQVCEFLGTYSKTNNQGVYKLNVVMKYNENTKEWFSSSIYTIQ